MSSSYDVVCMSHDPAIRCLWDLPASATERPELASTLERARQEHPHCDLAITRESGAVIAVGCIDPGDHGHASPLWIDMYVLRVIYQARQVNGAGGAGHQGLQQALSRFYQAQRCWPQERIERLRAIVELEPWSR